jgi:hypothetical protein
VSWRRSVISRRWIIAALAVAVVIAAAAASGTGDRAGRGERTPPPTATASPGARPVVRPVARPARHEAKPRRSLLARQGVDPQDTNPRLRARMRRAQRTGPAFQHLPYRGDGIYVDFGEARKGGRVQISVAYSGTRGEARAAYRRFLAIVHDPGTEYDVTYLSANG